MSWLKDPESNLPGQSISGYEERLKLPIEQRISFGLLREAEKILKALYRSNGVSDSKTLSNELTSTESILYLLDELSGPIGADRLVDVYSLNKVVLTCFGEDYVTKLKPEIEAIDVNRIEENKASPITIDLESRVALVV